MWRHLLFAGLAAIVWASGTSAAIAGGRGFTAQDLAGLDRISDVRLSPDGRFAVYDLAAVEMAANKRVHTIWIADVTGVAAPRRLTPPDDATPDARWSADGKSVYFVSARDGTAQVWKTTLSGGDSVQVTRCASDVTAFKLSPDGKRLLISMRVGDAGKGSPEVSDRASAAGDGIVYDRLFVRHWSAWSDGRRNRLFAVALSDAGLQAEQPIPLTNGVDADVPSEPFGDATEFGFMPDEEHAWFSARLNDGIEASSTSYAIFTVALDGRGEPVRIASRGWAWSTDLVASPDGKTVAYRATRRPGFESDRFHIVLRDTSTTKERELAADWDHSPERIVWSPDGKSIYAIADDLGQTRVFRIDIKTGAVLPLTSAGHVSSADVSADGLVYTLDTLTAPSDVFYLPFGASASIRITRHNAARLDGIAMGQPEQFRFTGWNGERVYGYVVRPANFIAGRRYPVAFIIHGGPQASFGNLFSYRWNVQPFAGAGYAVVIIDFHGSTGYGQAFTDAVSRHWGDRPLVDLQNGWAYALAHYPYLDGNRACALGGSYGGFMINWIAGKWSTPWKCFVNHDGIFDTRMQGYSTDELWFTQWENAGTPYDNPQAYRRFNPVRFVSNWSKPMMVVHGGKDFRDPLDQGIATFTALQLRHIPSQMLYFPDEGHFVLKPKNSVQWFDSVLQWLGRWLSQGSPLAADEARPG